MRGLKKSAVLAACGIAALSLAGCGASGGIPEENTYSIWLYNAQDASYYTDYAENPTLQYLLNRTWGPEEKKIAIEFQVPPSGRQQENYETMIASGDFPTVMANMVADAPTKMYEDEMILDLTELVREYMPNYCAILESNETVRSKSVFEIDGEEKILAIYGVNEDYPYYFSGNMYRRDWLVKYGANPQTGAAFTGGYTDENDVDSWEDDVVFPSGGADPVYISDWEWMFEIFEKAMEDQGITDGYCTSIYYPGYTWSGGLCSSFGGGIPVWYVAEDGSVQFGGDQEQMRAYFQCLNNWYEKGWLDSDFNERTSDIFYAIDDTAIRTGKVGMWVGIQGELGGRLDLKDGGFTEGIYAAGCALPINDVYGDESCQNKIPRCPMASTSLAGTGFLVMEGADEKDLGTLLSFFDYLYSEEGALMATLGLNAEQLAEDGVDASFYEKYGMADGAYTLGDDGRYRKCDALINDAGGLGNAVNLSVLPGKQLVSSVDNGYAKTYENSMATWLEYKNQGMFMGGDAMAMMPVEEGKIVGDVMGKVSTYMELHAYEFIKGKLDIDSDDDWNTWCTMLRKYNYQKASEVLQPWIDKYPIR
ncbi:MAG: hypothetical protein NC427_12480 [Ruminococcus flavefaciens]|nr:hypothetical protein [Ruminococcus flavefaciens]